MADRGMGLVVRVVLFVAAWLVPRDRRPGWRREWEAELSAARARGVPVRRLLTGALPDAWEVRRSARRDRVSQGENDGRRTMGREDGRVEGSRRRAAAWAAVEGGGELRRAFRSLLRAPGFTAASVLTLATGLGATAAIATLVDGILLRPLPYPAAERVVRVHHTFEGSEGPYPLARFAFPFLRDASRSFEVMGGHWSPGPYTLSGEASAERVTGVQATAELLDVLGARSVAGRLFTEEDAAVEALSGVVLGHGLWTRRFGADPGVVGSSVMVDGASRPVLGVMGPGVHLPGEKIDLWVPYAVPPGVQADDAFRIHVLGRLHEGVTPAQATVELVELTRRFPEFGGFYRTYLDDLELTTAVRSVRDEVVGAVERPLWILTGAVLIVLLVAAGNVATLFLVRAEARRHEVAVRAALGAGRTGLVGHFLAEGLWVATASGLAGLLIAGGAVRLFASLAPPDIPRLDELAVGWPTMAVVLGLALAIAAGLGLYPYLRFGRDGGDALRGKGTGETRAQTAVGGGLIVAQVAMALVLLSGTALLVRTFQELRAVDPGFEPDGILVSEFSLPPTSYPSSGEVRVFQERLLEAVEGLPGAQGAALGPSPLGERGCNGLHVEGMEVPEGQFPPCVPLLFVTPGYWEVLGIPRVTGRVFQPGDMDLTTTPVAVVTENVARRLWPGGDALTAAVHPSPRRGPPWFPVVGVTGDVRGRGPGQAATEAVYLPIGAMDDQGWLARTVTLLVATEPGREADLAPALRSVLANLDPGVPLTVRGALAREHARTMVRSTFTLFLLGSAAATALILGLVGLYGVVAYRVGRRRPEIGLRMALGARAGQVRMLVLGHSLRLVAVGTALGLLASALLAPTLSSLLFGVRPGDPLALTAAAGVLLLTATVASWLPAHRATRVDPSEALRQD